MIKRASAMNFSTIDENYSDYSEGETSEDVRLRDKASTIPKSKNSIQTLENHLNNLEQIDEYVSKDLRLSDDVYNIRDHGILNDKVQPQDHLIPIDNVLLMFAHSSHFSKAESDYLKSSPMVFGWHSIGSLSQNEFSASVYAFYKSLYQNLKPQIQVAQFISPLIEKMEKLQDFRREEKRGRIVFHHIGYGFPDFERDSMFVCEGRPPKFRLYPFRRLFENLKPPLYFIFDGNKSGSAISSIENASLVCQEKYGRMSSQTTRNLLLRDIDYDDWFCLCATGANENLPINPCLPRDFLTSCLLTPVSISILCHILRYYKTSFPSSNFPFSHLSKLLVNESTPEKDSLLSQIGAVTEAIAFEMLPFEDFVRLFRKDRLISISFQRFILAQYLLSPYDVNPVSFPKIPVMVKHDYWMKWETSIDMWVSSSIGGSPSFYNDFYLNSFHSIKYYMYIDRMDSMRLSLISLMCYIPFSGIDDCKSSYKLLSDFASRSENNSKIISSVIIFHSVFSELLIYSKSDIYDSVCSLVLTLLMVRSSLMFDIRTDFDYRSLLNKIFDESIDSDIRAKLAAIYVMVLPSINNYIVLFNNSAYVKSYKRIISKSSPHLLFWLLILNARVFDSYIIDIEPFNMSSVHIQICTNIFHSVSKCRASAIAAASVFMQNNQALINSSILLLALPSCFDMFFLSRYQIIQVCSKFLYYNKAFLSVYAHPTGLFSNLNSIFSLLGQWIRSPISTNSISFTEYSKLCHALLSEDDYLSHLILIAFSVLDFLSFDPVYTISKKALKIKSIFLPYTYQDSKAGTKSYSMSPPRGAFLSKNYDSSLSEDESDIKEDEEALVSSNDSDLLLHQSLNGFSYKRNTDENICIITSKPIESFDQAFHLRVKSSSRVLTFSPTRLVFDPYSLSSAVTTTHKGIHCLNEDNKIINRIQIGESEITDLQSARFMNELYYIGATSNGCIHICDTIHPYPKLSWRADPSIYCDNIPMFCSVSSAQSVIYTARGNSSIAKWDVSSQRLISEWQTDNKCLTTALSLFPSDDNLFVYGDSSGMIRSVDSRTPSKLFEVSLGEKAFKICRQGSNNIMAATPNGLTLTWDTRKNLLNPIGKVKGQLKCFDAHPYYPFIAYSTVSESPQIQFNDGSNMQSFPQVQPNTVFSFHPKDSVIVFVCANGELLSYDLI